MSNGWEALLGELTSKYNPKKSEHTAKGILEYACIYGIQDKQLYASHPKGWKLETYNFDCPQEDGSTKSVPVDEVVCAIAASKGQRGGGNAGAGIRINKKKMMYIRPSPDAANGAYLSCQGGGATIASTDKIVLVGIWNKEMSMSNKQMQNTGDCSLVVERMAKYLKSEGF